MKYFLNFLIALSVLFFFSCSKEEKQPNNKIPKQETKQDETENPSDTLMTPEEKFSSSIMIDFLDQPDDEDLEDYLQDELFKYSKDYRGASVLQLTNATWFVTLQNSGSAKNFILQKFVDFNSNDYYFILKETSLGITDVVTSANLYRNSSLMNNKESQTTQNQTQNK